MQAIFKAAKKLSLLDTILLQKKCLLNINYKKTYTKLKFELYLQDLFEKNF